MHTNFRKIRTVILIPTVLIFVSPFFAQAHVLQTDNTIGAVLHVDPNDQPIAQQEASFFLEFKDTAKKFKSQDCACTVTIEKNGQKLFKKEVSVNEQFVYVFPEAAIYNFFVDGQPKESGQFQPFHLEYDLRVTPPVDSGLSKAVSSVDFTSSEHTAHYILILAGLGIIFLLFLKGKYKVRKKPENNLYN